MSGGLKRIQSRLKTVTNIQKITKSMKMVSSVKLRKAEEELKQCKSIGVGVKQFLQNMKVFPEKQKILYVAVTSDRGLCGSVNASIIRQMRRWLRDKSRPDFRIFCVGDKTRAGLQAQYKEKMVMVATGISRKPATYLDASKIADKIIRVAYQYSEIHIVYTTLVSLASFSLTTRIFFHQDEIEKAKNIAVYDSLDNTVISDHMQAMLAAYVYYALKQTSASEHAARVTAMDNSTKSAGEMIERLRTTYNRTRQAAITNELIEIISAANAMKKTD